MIPLEVPRGTGPTIGTVMHTPVFAVRPHDYVIRAADLMEWKHIRHVPVTDDRGGLVGLVTYRDILHLLAVASDRPVPVFNVMRRDPVAVTPDTSCLDALSLMRDTDVGCLPVVESATCRSLVGIVTASDFIAMSAGLLDAWLRE